MDPLTLGAGLLGLVLGGVAGWLAARSAGARQHAEAMLRSSADLSAANAKLEAAAARLGALEGERADLVRQVDALHAEVMSLREAQARLAAVLDAEKRQSAEKLAILGQAETTLREAFATLSAEALRQNNQSFLDLARASLGEHQQRAASDFEARQKAIGDLVAPVRESLEKVDAKLQQVEKDRISSHSALDTQLKNLASTEQTLQRETANLVKALRVPTVRGRWGEIQLKRVVELAGMLDHCDFYEQQGVNGEQGRLIPDLLVRLPGGRTLVVDAKAPLSAYLEALEATDDALREARLKEHARQVRTHMAKLSSKAYWEQFQPAPEFVVMFLPGETFFGAALLHDPTLLEAGVDQRVILASPITLIALLRAVAYGWRQEKLAENAQAISESGRLLYDRIRVLTEHFENLGHALDKAVEAYNQAVGSFESRVLVTARRLKEMGASVSKDLPEIEVIDRTARALRAPELPLTEDEEPALDAEIVTPGDVEQA
jgi:DNA recombination protein RmuC